MTIAPEVVVAAFSALLAATGRAAWVIYRDLRQDRDDWKAIALRSTGVSEKATDVAVTAVKPDA